MMFHSNICFNSGPNYSKPQYTHNITYLSKRTEKKTGIENSGFMHKFKNSQHTFKKNDVQKKTIREDIIREQA